MLKALDPLREFTYPSILLRLGLAMLPLMHRRGGNPQQLPQRLLGQPLPLAKKTDAVCVHGFHLLFSI